MASALLHQGLFPPTVDTPLVQTKMPESVVTEEEELVDLFWPVNVVLAEMMTSLLVVTVGPLWSDGQLMSNDTDEATLDVSTARKNLSF